MQKKILIVEDNNLNRKLFDNILRAVGYETHLSEDGEPISEIVREAKPDLIIMDIQLPVRSGVELMHELRENQEFDHIPIVAVTAFAMAGDEKKFRIAGFDDYIAKPIKVPDFLARIGQQFDARSKSRAHGTAD